MGYFFVLPFIIGFLAFTVYPLIQSMFFSFQDITYNMDGYHTQPVGIEHYTYLLVKDPSYRLLLLNSLKDMLLNVPLIVFFSFFAANLLNQKFRGRLLARAIFFLPVILASSSVLGMNVDAIMASASGGTGIGETARETVNLSMQMQTFLKSVNLPGGFTDYVISGVKRITTIISASGVQILLFLAGLQSVTPSQLEAAHMEGANSWEIFWKITVPIVSPSFWSAPCIPLSIPLPPIPTPLSRRYRGNMPACSSDGFGHVLAVYPGGFSDYRPGLRAAVQSGVLSR